MKWAAISSSRGSSWPALPGFPELASGFVITVPPGKPTGIDIPCNWLNTLLKVKNRTAVWGQNRCQRVSCLLSWLCGWLGAAAHCCCPASQESVILYCMSLVQEKIKIQSSECGFYWVHTTFIPCKVENLYVETLSHGHQCVHVYVCVCVYIYIYIYDYI